MIRINLPALLCNLLFEECNQLKKDIQDTNQKISISAEFVLSSVPPSLSLSLEILPAAFAARVDDGVPITIE